MNMMMDMLSEEPTNHTNEIQNFESLAYFFVNERNSCCQLTESKSMYFEVQNKYVMDGLQY